MIQTLKDKHKGATIAIIGSGPTANVYCEKEDIAIALNGAIQLDKKIDYFMAFDNSVPYLNYYYTSKKATRLIGANIASVDKVLYPNLPDRQRKLIIGSNVTEVNFHLKSLKPVSPHLYWYFQLRREPVFNPDVTYLSAMGNICVPAIEAAVIMGCSTMHIYGIDLGKRGYFYGARKGNYDVRRANYTNSMLTLCINNGINVRVSRGSTSRITVGDNI